jgi:drug/metabolite transporter (DMT)-like permease
MVRERIATGTVLGVVAGFIGVAILIVPEGITGRVDVLSMLMIVGASISWSIGTFVSKRLDLPHDPLASTGVQMLFGGVALLATGVLTGETVQPEHYSIQSLLSLGYLILFGSVLAYTAYTWVLVHASVSRVSTYAYVNPVVAVFLGWLLLHETVDLTMIIGAAVIIASVWIVIRTEARRPKLSAGAASAEGVA